MICKILPYRTSETNIDEDTHDTTRSSRMRMTTTTATTNSTMNPPAETRRFLSSVFSSVGWTGEDSYSGDPWVLFILTVLGIICAVILVLPTIPEPETNSQTKIPSYLHMTTNAKVIASYVLGKQMGADGRCLTSLLPRSTHCGFHSSIVTTVYSLVLIPLFVDLHDQPVIVLCNIRFLSSCLCLCLCSTCGC